MAPLDAGRYIITNVKFQNVAAALPDIDDESNVTSELSEKWDVVLLENGNYRLHNYGRPSFHNGHPKAYAGENILGVDRAQEWRIKEWGKGHYSIDCARGCWSLKYRRNETPITFAQSPNDPKNQWMFTKVSDEVTPISGMASECHEACTSTPIATTSADNSDTMTVANIMVNTLRGTTPIPELVRHLRSDRIQVQKIAVEWLSKITINDETRVAALQSNAIPALVHLLVSSNNTVLENAARALTHINVLKDANMVSVEAGAMPHLVNLLESDDTQVLRRACGALRNICWHNSVARAAALNAGVVPHLVRLLSRTEASNDTNIQARAAWALSTINILYDAHVVSLEAGAIPPLVKLLASNDSNTQLRACDALKNICWSQDVARVAALRAGAVPPLVRLLSHDGRRHTLIQASAAWALSNINALSDANTVSVDADAIPVLIKLLASNDTLVLQRACKAIRNICWSKDVARAAAVSAGAVPPLVGLLSHDGEGSSGHESVPACAAWALSNINVLPDANMVSVEAGAIPALINLLASDDIKVLKYASGALRNVSWSKDASRAALSAGAIPPMVRLLSSDDVYIQSAVALTLNNINVHAEANMASVEAGAIPPVIKLLASNDPKVLQRACEALRNMCWSKDTAQAAALRAGAVPPLVRLLSHDGERRTNIQVTAAWALSNINALEDANNPSVEAGALPPLVKLLGSDDAVVLQRACSTIRNIYWSKDAARAAAVKAGAVPPLVRLLSGDRSVDAETPGHESLQASAARALSTLNIFPDANRVSVEAGAIPALVKLLASRDTQVLRYSCAAMRRILAKHDDVRATAAKAGTVPLLVGLLSHDAVEVQISAAGALAKISLHGPAQIAALDSDVIPDLVHLLASNDNTVQENAASALVSINAFPNARSVSVKENAVPALVKLLASDDAKVLRHACDALKNICWSLPAAHSAALKADAIPRLVVLLSSKDLAVQASAVTALEKITEYDLAKGELRKCAAVPALRALRASGDPEARRSAARILKRIRIGLFHSAILSRIQKAFVSCVCQEMAFA